MYDYKLATDMMRLRVILAGSGLYGKSGEMDDEVDLFVMPGGYIVRLQRTKKDVFGSIMFPCGGLVMNPMPLKGSIKLAHFMTELDACIFKSFSGPVSQIIDLANEIAYTNMEIPGGIKIPTYIDMPDFIDTWEPNSDALFVINEFEEFIDTDRIPQVSNYLERRGGRIANSSPKRQFISILSQFNTWITKSSINDRDNKIERDGSWKRIYTVPALMVAVTLMLKSDGCINADGNKAAEEDANFLDIAIKKQMSSEKAFLDVSLIMFTLTKEHPKTTLIACINPETGNIVVKGNTASLWARKMSLKLLESGDHLYPEV